MYTIKQLKEIIETLPDDMEVISAGHFGEALECIDIESALIDIKISSDEKKEALVLRFNGLGPDPGCW